MSKSLSNSSPEQTPKADPAERFSVLSQASWPGLDLLLCREDIRAPTRWAIRQPRHTLIVHLGGAMRRLDTEIEGAGGCHQSPSPGDIWLVPADQRYEGRALGHVITYAELRIWPKVDLALPHCRHGQLSHLPPRQGHRDDYLYRSITQLSRWIAAGDDLSGMMADQLQQLVRLHLFADYQGQAVIMQARDARLALPATLVRRLSDHVEAHLAERITLADLAQLTQSSVHRFLIAFRRSFGTTPAQYVLDKRVQRARWLLLNSRQEIAEIALATGFASHSHFSSAFRHRVGVSPRQFREGQRTLVLPAG